MKFNKLMICAIFLLALLTLGAVSAADDMVNVGDNDLKLSQSSDDLVSKDLNDYDNLGVVNAENEFGIESNESFSYLGEANNDNTVTPENFNDFFDGDGILKDDVTSDELVFKGEFDSLVEKLVIERPLTIRGDNAILNNMGVYIASDDVILNNLTFIANDTYLGSLIYNEGSNVDLINLNVNYHAGAEEAVGVDIKACSDVRLLNSTLFFESHVIDDEHISVSIQAVDTQNVVIDGNNITTKLPCVSVNNYDEDYSAMGSNNVNPVRLKDCSNLRFTNNYVDSTTNNCSAEFPTIQSIYMIGCSDSLVDHNNISMIDEFTPSGMDNYMYGIVFGHNSNVTFSYNNFNMSTDGGKVAAGTAYAFQGIESDIIIKGNHITSRSYGPNLGVYVASLAGETSELLIVDNFINVTGSASPVGTWALVSGIEIQNGNAKIYNNTIYTYNVLDYREGAYFYGISYAQWMYGDRSFDIQNNTVYTEGKYTISIINSTSLYVAGNTLYARELSGDDSINPGISSNVIIGENLPLKANITIDVEDSWLGEDNEVNVTVEDKTGNVTIKVNDKELVTEEDLVDSTFNYTISAGDLIKGKNTIEVIFKDLDNETSLKKATFNVIGNLNPDLTIAAENITRGQVAVVNVTVNPNATGVLRFKLNGISYPIEINEKGKGRVTLPDLVFGTYIAEAVFESSNLRYNSSEVNTTFKVAKLDSEIKVDIDEASLGSDVDVNISVFGATGNVTVIVDGKKQDIPLENGNATLNIENIAAGNHSVVVVYWGDDYYSSNVESKTFYVDKLTPTILISPIDVQYAGNAITIHVTNDTAVNVAVNGKDYALSEGVITIEDGLTAGEYIVVATASENENYYAGSNSTLFTVVKEKSEVHVDCDSKIKVGEETTISVDVTNGATGKVIINVDGNEFAIDLSKTSNLTVAFDMAGEYTISAAYSGDDRFNESASEEAVIVVEDKSPSNINVEVPDVALVGEEVTVEVSSDNDEITVYINGEAQNIAQVDKSVQFKPEKEGIYNITVIASENSEYASQIYTKVIMAVKNNTTLNIEPIADAKVGDNITIKVDNITDGELTIKVNGEAVTDEYEIIKAGSYTITVESASTDAFNAGFATYTFNVEEEPIEPETNMTVIVDGKGYVADLVNGTPVVVTDRVDSVNVTVIVDGKGYVADLVNGTPVVVTGKVDSVNVTVIVDGKGYVADLVNGTVSVVTDKEDITNITVVVDGKAYSGVVVNGTVSVVTDKEDITNITVVVDGKMYSAEVVDGKAVVDTNPSQPVKTPINVSVPENIKLGESASVDVNISGATGNVSVIVDGKETVVPLVNGSASVLLDNLSEGIHSVVVVYGGDETHAPVHSASSFKVDEIPVMVPIASEFSEITIGDNQTISIVLKDAEGQAIADAHIRYSVNGVINNTTADIDGKFTIKCENGAVIFINYEGNAFIIGTNTTLTLNNLTVPVVVKVASHFNVSGSVITIKGYAVDTKAGEEGIYYSTELLDVNGNPIKGVEIQFALNDNIYNRTTDENGSFEPYKLNMASAGKYTMVLFFAGNDRYTGALATVCFDLSKKSIKIKASSKTFKVNKKVKYTITISTIVGSSHDGKAHLKTGKVAKLTLNGKTYSGKTNKNGKVTFNIKSTKKGKFTATITVKQDSTYSKATKKIKLTFK